MLMILPTILLLGVLGYFFYTSKKEFSLNHQDPIGNQKENDYLYKDLEDLFYLKFLYRYLKTLFLD